jgi:hypothetical protein
MAAETAANAAVTVSTVAADVTALVVGHFEVPAGGKDFGISADDIRCGRVARQPGYAPGRGTCTGPVSLRPGPSPVEVVPQVGPAVGREDPLPEAMVRGPFCIPPSVNSLMQGANSTDSC